MERETKIDITPIMIQPASVSITAISIEVFRLVLNSLIELRVIRKTASGIYDIQHVIIEGTDYSHINNATATNRDTAIINKVLATLTNLDPSKKYEIAPTPAPTPTPAPSPTPSPTPSPSN
jgi:hypothetical protein